MIFEELALGCGEFSAEQLAEAEMLRAGYMPLARDPYHFACTTSLPLDWLSNLAKKREDGKAREVWWSS